jgi:hypothetical protein
LPAPFPTVPVWFLDARRSHPDGLRPGPVVQDPHNGGLARRRGQCAAAGVPRKWPAAARGETPRRVHEPEESSGTCRQPLVI